MWQTLEPEKPESGLIIDFSATTRPISTKLGVWIDLLCQSTNLKNKYDRDVQRRVTASKLKVPFSRQLLDRFQLKLMWGCIQYVQVYT